LNLPDSSKKQRVDALFFFEFYSFSSIGPTIGTCKIQAMWQPTEMGELRILSSK
jgi:hypothetical protein